MSAFLTVNPPHSNFRRSCNFEFKVFWVLATDTFQEIAKNVLFSLDIQPYSQTFIVQGIPHGKLGRTMVTILDGNVAHLKKENRYFC